MALNSTYFPNGFGELTGDSLVTTAPWYTSGTIYYVSSALGDDTNAGTERLQPKKTVGSAETAASSGDIIILASDHDETLTATLALSAGITIVGAGSSSGQPTAKLTNNSATTELIDVRGANCAVIGILFPTNDQTNAAARVAIGSVEFAAVDNFILRGCRFESTSTDTGAAVDLAAGDRGTIDDCQFVVTSTTGTSPGSGLEITDVNMDGLIIRDTTFDGGTLGYEDGIALKGAASTMTFARFENVSLLNGADATIEASSGGRMNFVNTTGSGRVIFS
jgi:hypothetical protein